MSEQSTRIILGQINGLYGVRGWVKVFSYTNPITNLLNYSPWQLCQHGHWQTLSVHEGKKHGKGIIARLESNHDCRDKVAGLVGADIAVWRSQFPIINKDEYYWADLVGLTVINHKGITLGQVDYLLETGANDVLVLKGKRECLIPFLLERVILEVDLVGRVLRVDWEEDF